MGCLSLVQLAHARCPARPQGCRHSASLQHCQGLRLQRGKGSWSPERQQCLTWEERSRARTRAALLSWALLQKLATICCSNPKAKELSRFYNPNHKVHGTECSSVWQRAVSCSWYNLYFASWRDCIYRNRKVKGLCLGSVQVAFLTVWDLGWEVTYPTRKQAWKDRSQFTSCTDPFLPVWTRALAKVESLRIRQVASRGGLEPSAPICKPSA